MTTLVSQTVPDFIAPAVLANGTIMDQFHLHTEIENRYAIILFYPLDFTFVCPSELIALNNRIEEFKKRNVLLLGISIDSQFSHQAWRNTPVAQGGVGSLQYPLIADVNHSITKNYGIEHPKANVALRSTIIVDKEKIVRAQITYDLSLGRDIDEFIRLIDALTFQEEHGEVCPAGWTQGQTGIEPTAKGIAKYLSESATDL